MTLDPLWVSVFVTFILVCITGYYALETRRMRIGAVKPLFSLRTGFPIRGEPMELYLMNNGGLAKDVKIDVFLNKVLKHNYYLASIPNDGYVNLDVSLNKCKKNNDDIDIKIEYKDSYRWRKKKQAFDLNYTELTKDNRVIKYYYTSIENKLLTIHHDLIQFLNAINDNKFKSDKITVYPTEKPARGMRKK